MNSIIKKQTYWNNVASDYSKIEPLYNKFYNKLIKMVNYNDSEILVLDLACGSGELSCSLLKRYSKVKVIMVDFASEFEKEITLKMNHNNICNTRYKFIEGDMMALPINDNQFDVVICSNSLMYGDIDECFHEIRRVLKPSGQFLVSIWDKEENCDFIKPFHCLLRNLFNNRFPPAFVDITNLSNIEELSSVIEEYGFKDIKIIKKSYEIKYASSIDNMWNKDKAIINTLIQILLKIGFLKESMVSNIESDYKNQCNKFKTDDGVVMKNNTMFIINMNC